MNPEIEALVSEQPVVLIFVPNTNELQRFVLSGAFDGIARGHQLQFVLPEEDAEKMRRAAPVLHDGNSTTLRVPAARFEKWAAIFNQGCVHYAHLSPSFAIRAGLEVDPDWRQHWNATPAERAELDAAFDATVEQMLSGMQPLPEIVELFNRFKPVYCVVPTSLLDLFCNEVAWACEAENVTCLLLQSGWDNLSSKGLLHSRRSFLGCWGRQSREHAAVVQRVPSKLLVPLGAPHYEFLKRPHDDDVRTLRAALGAAAGDRLILFGGSFRQFDETAALQELDRVIASGRVGPARVVYRPHPWRAARQHEDSFFAHEWKHVVFDPDMRERYLREQAEAGYIKRNVPMFDMAYLATLVAACDAVISPMSTLLLEALILEKPTLAIAFGDGKHRHDPSVTAQMTHFDDLKTSKALIWCDSSDRLMKDVGRLLRRIGIDKHTNSRTWLLDRVVTTAPGTYAERLETLCRTVVEPAGRKLRARRTAAQRNTISHAYGAHLIAREYCSIHDRDLAVPGYWMHGWIPAFHNVHPALIALHKKEGQYGEYDFEAQIEQEKQDTVQWVSRRDQADYLRAHGYRHVKAIGLPFAYIPPPDVRRVPGSLLVLPPHSHKNHGPQDPIAERYADAVADLKGRFAYIAVGVNEDDMAKNQWVESFRRRGIPVFTTTDQSSPRTLVRLRRILGTFEYVTTNGFGSHIALAAYAGAKVSVYGPYAEFPIHRMKVTHAVRMFPHLLEQAHYLCTEAPLRQHYPFLFVEPDKAVPLLEWGAHEVGEPARVSPPELKRLLGWENVPSASNAGSAAAADRPLVLFAMAHAGFFRNFEGVIGGLLRAGVDVHIHFGKAHGTISMDDYDQPRGAAIGRLTHSTNDAGASSNWRIDGIRILRDLVMYAEPHYDEAVDLRARFFDLQKDHVIPRSTQRALLQILRWTPDFVRRALDRFLRRQDERTPAPAAAHVIDSLKPDYVVATPLVNFASREVDLVKAARARGIPTLLAVASWDNLTNKGRIKIEPDRVAVWNEAMAREAVELHGIARDRVWITGAPVFDPWFGRSPAQGREAFLRALHLDLDRPLLVYLCSSHSIAGNREREIVKRWLRRIRKHRDLASANVIIRPHPMASGTWAEVVTPNEHGMPSMLNAVVWPFEPKHPTTPQTRAEFFDTLFHADAIVGLNTSAMIEAAILGRPVFTFVGHEQAQSQVGNLHFRHLAGGGFVNRAENLDEHIEQLAQLGRRESVEAGVRFVDTFVRPLGRDVEAAATLAGMILGEMRVSRSASAPDDEAVLSAAESPSRA